MVIIDIVGWIGVIYVILGVIGIIRSDLAGESRKKDTFGQVGKGWLSRPVVGAVCFVAFLGL